MNDPASTSNPTAETTRSSDSLPSPAEIAAQVMVCVREVAREQSRNMEGLNEESNLFEVGFDSLEQMDIVGRVEEVFGTRLPVDQLYDVETCGDLIAVVEGRLADVAKTKSEGNEISPECYIFEQMPEFVQTRGLVEAAQASGEKNPFFAVHDGISSNVTILDGRELVNYAGYNYLGLSGNPEVSEAAKAAIDLYGTSVSASRLVSGTKPIHEELEREFAEFLGVEAVLAFATGYGTNTAAIGHLMRPGDLILYDELSHNSIITGAILSHASRRAFPHGDMEALDALLTEVRGRYHKVLIAVDAVYSMDGDYADAPRLIELKKKHKALLLLDEAHSIGTMGETGRGMKEFFGLHSNDVDIWMGTYSKAFSANGGYIAGSKTLIEYLRLTCPGMIFTAGIAPACTAAILASLRILKRSSERVLALQKNSKYLLDRLNQLDVDTGPSCGTQIIPLIFGNSIKSLRVSRLLEERGFVVPPIIHPAVEESGARLRFMITSLHTEEQLAATADALAEVLQIIAQDESANQ